MLPERIRAGAPAPKPGRQAGLNAGKDPRRAEQAGNNCQRGRRATAPYPRMQRGEQPGTAGAGNQDVGFRLFDCRLQAPPEPATQ